MVGKSFSMEFLKYTAQNISRNTALLVPYRSCIIKYPNFDPHLKACQKNTVGQLVSYNKNSASKFLIHRKFNAGIALLRCMGRLLHFFDFENCEYMAFF